MGRFRTSLAPEASGIAASARNPGLLYVLDDGPGTTSLLVVRTRDGKIRGELEIAGLDGVDTEDLAVGPCAAVLADPCIYIGDIGDNLRARDTISVIRAVEPDLSGALPDERVPAEAATLRYPDRPHDGEALMVAEDASLVIVTKDPGRRKRGAARLYTAASFDTTTLSRGRRLRLPSPGLPFAAAVVGNVVTSADSVPGRVVVRTYDALYEFLADESASLREFPSWESREIAAPAEGQGEAVTYGPDGCSLFTVGEGSGRITSLPCR